MCTKRIVNKNYKILATNDVNTLPNEDKLLQNPLVSSIDYILPDLSLLLFQESRFSTSNSTILFIHSALASFTQTIHSKKNCNLNKHDLKDERIEQPHAKLKALKYFTIEQLNVMKKVNKDLQSQKATLSHSVVKIL